MREESQNLNPKGIVKSEFQNGYIFPKCSTFCTKLSGLPKIKLKIAIQLPKTHIYTLARVLSTTTTASLATKRKLRKKVRKSVNNVKKYFKQLFTFLETTSVFIISIFRVIYRSSSPDAFTKKDVLLQVRSIFTEEYPCETFAWMFSCKLSKYLQNTSSEKHFWVTASVYMKVNTTCAYWHSPVQS